MANTRKSLSALRRGFSLVELLLIVTIMAVLAAIILPMVMDMANTGRETNQLRSVQLWNGTYVEAYAAAPELATIGDWDVISARMAAGVTADLAEGSVTFACQPPKFVNEGNPTFEIGRGITAVP